MSTVGMWIEGVPQDYFFVRKHYIKGQNLVLESGTPDTCISVSIPPRSCKAKVSLLLFFVKIQKCNGSLELLTPKNTPVIT